MSDPPSKSQTSVLSPESASLGVIRLGLLGGTFNPVHNGHLAIARHTREALAFDRILFIPTGDPPHKPDMALAPAKDRYEMVRLAIESDRTLAVSDIEIRREGKSYTVDTIRVLREQYGTDAEFFFIIGIDAFLEFPSWKNTEELLHSCHFVVVSRPGSTFTPLVHMPALSPIISASSAEFGKDTHKCTVQLGRLDGRRQDRLDLQIPGGKTVILLNLPPCEISASDIRTRIRQGRAVANLLPPAVESYILHHHLYA